MHLLPASERKPQPWKNGGGVTFEVAVMPDPESGSFLWRVSIAAIDVPGPFSPYPGIDRTLAVLTGEVMLSGAAIGEVALSAGSDPLSFSGDEPIEGRPVSSSTDLNVMTRAGKVRHVMRRVEFTDFELPTLSGTRLIVAGAAPFRASDGQDCLVLAPFDAVMETRPGTALALSAAESAVAYVIDIW